MAIIQTPIDIISNVFAFAGLMIQSFAPFFTLLIGILLAFFILPILIGFMGDVFEARRERRQEIEDVAFLRAAGIRTEKIVKPQKTEKEIAIAEAEARLRKLHYKII